MKMLLHILTVNAMNYDLHIHIRTLKYLYDFPTEFTNLKIIVVLVVFKS